VVVLWRPFHEMNGDWFWWGGKDPDVFIQIWRHMFDYFTKTKDLDNLRTSMMMHDIGKIATPDAVLLKPAKLDPMEWEIMKRHTTQGGEILGRGPHLKVAVEIATCHHEKWDGSGYPQGLSGAGIPVAARLAAIIDVFDALSSKRPYKDPMPPEQVVSILKEGSGKHFDPQMVDLFLSRIEEMREVYKSMS